jgi:hypothetical protein
VILCLANNSVRRAANRESVGAMNSQPSSTATLLVILGRRGEQFTTWRG